jgi:4-hydroxybenzoate polyprenyltransferase
MLSQNQIFPVKLFSTDFLGYYWITMRPYLLFVSGITGIAGLSFAPARSLFTTTVLFLTFFLSYGFGQALTDCFQIDTDSLSSPYRPLTQGVISKKSVLKVSLSGILLIGIILTAHALINAFLASFATLGLATYTYFKKRWWAGPFYNAWVGTLLCLIAYIAGSGTIHTRMDAEFYLVLFVVFFGYANFVLSGYFKDITADRKTGYNTLPVVYGLKVSKLISDIFAVITALLCGTVLYLFYLSNPFGLIHTSAGIVFIFGCIASLIAQIRLHTVQDESDAHRAISLVVHAYILLLASVAILQKPDWSLFISIFYLGFIITMKFRPMKEQI